jgi:hypothetical protein
MIPKCKLLVLDSPPILLNHEEHEEEKEEKKDR